MKNVGGGTVAVLFLTRNYGEQATNGSITFKGEHICHSIELPWRNNLKRLSCIPEGRYRLIRQQYHKHGDQLGLMNVLNREAILIHAANDALKELLGCIAPVTTLTGDGKGSESKKALQALKDVVYPLMKKGLKVWLIIRDSGSVTRNSVLTPTDIKPSPSSA